MSGEPGRKPADTLLGEGVACPGEYEFLHKSNAIILLREIYRIRVEQGLGRARPGDGERAMELEREIDRLRGDLPESIVAEAINQDLEALILFLAFRLLNEAYLDAEELLQLADDTHQKKMRFWCRSEL